MNMKPNDRQNSKQTTACMSPTPSDSPLLFYGALRATFLGFLAGCCDEGGRDDVRSCAPCGILLVTNSPPAGDTSALHMILVA
jgi:hypothetical protein